MPREVHKVRHKGFVAAALLLYVVLGSWKGYLAVFEGAAEEPRQIYPLKIDTLPEDAQQALLGGILVRSPDRLKELLEQYLS